MNFDNVMLDLETLGTAPGSVLLSVGAVFFGPEGLGPEFHQIISLPASRAMGLKVSADTEAWWQKQSEEAKATLYAAYEAGADPAKVFADFNDFLGPKVAEVKLWGNGSDFDNVLLIAAMEQCSVKPAWKYYNHRCFRTLKNLRPQLKQERQGTYHNALDDAKTQALHAVALLKELGCAY